MASYTMRSGIDRCKVGGSPVMIASGFGLFGVSSVTGGVNEAEKW
jgi:hypothetical protein